MIWCYGTGSRKTSQNDRLELEFEVQKGLSFKAVVKWSLKNSQSLYISWCGGIGRHDGLKIR